MSGADPNWPRQAAREGAAVSADPGESGDLGGAPGERERTFRTPDSDPDAETASPSNRLAGAGDPAEGGDVDDQFRPREQPDIQGPGPGDHLTGGGDPAEGRR
jgi:hypothetical protein